MALSRIRPNSTDKPVLALQYVFRQHLYIPHKSPDDGLSEPKPVVSAMIKTPVCVTATPPFLFEFNWFKMGFM
jgi:hypothetical protein